MTHSTPSESAASHRPRVVIAGASGFIGRALIARLHERFDLVGLTRDPAAAASRTPAGLRIQWRTCDLFSLLDVEQALSGADYAVYLVHSMQPSAHLTQGSFADLDLLLADNFARAASRCGVTRILYLGGILPTQGPLSPHLASRLEVERVLGAGAAALTALRAGLVVGERGSSFRILERLVARLPIMLCPSWTQVRTQPIALEDVVTLLERALDDPGTAGVTSDVGGPDVMTYLEMIERTARAMGREPRLVPVPFLSPGLSRLWVSAVTGDARELVDPLVESLKLPMVAGERVLQERWGIEGIAFDDALRRALGGGGGQQSAEVVSEKRDEAISSASREGRPSAIVTTARTIAPTPTPPSPSSLLSLRTDKRVCSVQRLPRVPGWDAERVAQEYAAWLPRAMRPLIRVHVEPDGTMRFRAAGLSPPLLRLQYADERSESNRQLFYITGGLLADTSRSLRGRLEFRVVPEADCVIAAIHDFTPRLPWYVYNLSQARVHLWVMRRFARHLARKATGG